MINKGYNIGKGLGFWNQQQQQNLFWNDIKGVVNGLGGAANGIWAAVDPNSHAQHGQHLNTGLGIMNSFNQQQMQQLFWDDFRKGWNMVKDGVNRAAPVFNDVWSKLDPNSYNQYGDAVNQGIDTFNKLPVQQ